MAKAAPLPWEAERVALGPGWATRRPSEQDIPESPAGGGLAAAASVFGASTGVSLLLERTRRLRALVA